MISGCRRGTDWKGYGDCVEGNTAFASTINGGSAFFGGRMAFMMSKSWIIIRR